MDNKQLIQRLKEERKKRNITQGDVAKYLNVDISAISLYESGKRAINMEILNEWLQYFNLRFEIITSDSPGIDEIDFEELELFRRLKQERNSLVKEVHLKQIEYLQPLFPDKKFIASAQTSYVAILDEMFTNTGEDIAVIYYKNVLINATFTELKDVTLMNDDMHYSNNIARHTYVIPFLRDHTSIDTIPFDKIRLNDDGIIMYRDDDLVFIKDAKGTVPDKLLEAQNLLERYNEELDAAYDYVVQTIGNYKEKMKEIEHQLFELAKKWKINPFTYHPKFNPWTEEDLEATRTGMEVTEADIENFSVAYDIEGY
ncbi:helix-turn-helix transcriptional regulator [Priestia filamentosa]|uniref:helix-turn-helix domain-containing protein n=1 Tax=Priestia filamentosa TaxID=1402861 RepID=UPI00398206AA